jgi:hypothetical protein
LNIVVHDGITVPRGLKGTGQSWSRQNLEGGAPSPPNARSGNLCGLAEYCFGSVRRWTRIRLGHSHPSASSAGGNSAFQFPRGLRILPIGCGVFEPQSNRSEEAFQRRDRDNRIQDRKPGDRETSRRSDHDLRSPV